MKQLRVVILEPASGISLRIEVHGCRAEEEVLTTKYLVKTSTVKTVKTTMPTKAESTTGLICLIVN